MFMSFGSLSPSQLANLCESMEAGFRSHRIAEYHEVEEGEVPGPEPVGFELRGRRGYLENDTR